MLDHLGQVEDAESVLRALAERRPDALEPWLDLIRHQGERKKSQAVAETIALVKSRVKLDPPELLEARCRFAAGDIPAADKAYAAAVARKPGDLEIRTEAARFYESDKVARPRDAEECLRAVLQADPKHRRAARQLAVILSAPDRTSNDREAWERAWAVLGPEADNEPDPEDRLARAIVLTRSPNPTRRPQGLERLKGLLADLPVRNPAAAHTRDYLVRYLLDTNQPSEAATLARVSASGGTDPAAIALYARALIQSKKITEAEYQLNRLGALSPGDPDEVRLRARLHWDSSRPVESATDLVRRYSAVEGSPGAEALGREIFLILIDAGSGTNAAAERIGRRIAEKNRGASWMPAMAAARASRFDDALQLLQTAVRARPGFEDLRESCRVAVRIAVSTDDPVTLRKVDAILSESRAAAPNEDDLAIMCAYLRHMQANFEEEVKLYQAVLEHRPDNYVVLNNLAWALSEGVNRAPEALKLVDQLIKLAGRDVQALDTRGIILARLGRFDEALHDLEEVIKSEPTPQHHFHMARVYLQAGRTDDARRSMELARQGGLTPREVDPAERGALESLNKLLAGSNPTAGSRAEVSASVR
jgi:tetratricopeptide (TPR) repeat protein